MMSVQASAGPLGYDLRGKVCVVTGGGSGIGRAVALGMAQCGGTVVIAGRRQSSLDETLDFIRAEMGSTVAAAAAPAPAPAAVPPLLAVTADVTDEDSVENLFASAVAQFGRVDVLFNNAGVGAPPVPLEDMPLATWRNVVDINLTGMFLCTRGAFRVMKAQQHPQGGRIINNGSVSAVSPRPFSCAYTSTKHAVTGLTKSTSLDGRKVGPLLFLFLRGWIVEPGCSSALAVESCCYCWPAVNRLSRECVHERGSERPRHFASRAGRRRCRYSSSMTSRAAKSTSATPRRT